METSAGGPEPLRGRVGAGAGAQMLGHSRIDVLQAEEQIDSSLGRSSPASPEDATHSGDRTLAPAGESRKPSLGAYITPIGPTNKPSATFFCSSLNDA